MSDQNSSIRRYLDALKAPDAPPTQAAPHDLLRAMETLASSGPPPLPEKCPALKLQDCVTFGKKMIETNKITKDSALQWVRRVRFALRSMFGNEAAIVKDLDILLKEIQQKGLSQSQFSQKIADLESFVDYLNQLSNFPLACAVSKTSRAPSTKDIFIIHGHDELNTRRLTHILSSEFGLNPIAMLAKPGMSRPLTQKFEDEAQTCSFAFALFTPDDEILTQVGPYKQARPNVIYEVGWFIGRLGRARVALILKKGTKIHSDLDGVSQIHFSEDVSEKFLEIRKELIAAKLVQ